MELYNELVQRVEMLKGFGRRLQAEITEIDAKLSVIDADLLNDDRSTRAELISKREHTSKRLATYSNMSEQEQLRYIGQDGEIQRLGKEIANNAQEHYISSIGQFKALTDELKQLRIDYLEKLREIGAIYAESKRWSDAGNYANRLLGDNKLIPTLPGSDILSNAGGTCEITRTELLHYFNKGGKQ